MQPNAQLRLCNRLVLITNNQADSRSVSFKCTYICPFYLIIRYLKNQKYEQSPETVRRFIAVSEKELELYYRHVALYGIPQSQKAVLVCGDDREASLLKMGGLDQGKDQLPHVTTDHFSDFHISDVSESDEEDTSGSEYDVNDNDTEGMINISEDVISDHGVLANRK